MKKKLAILISITFMIIMTSCTSSGRLTRPQKESRFSRVPMIDILISESPVQSIKFHGTFLLKAPEGEYQVSSSTMEYFAFFDNGQLTFRSSRRKFNFKSGFPLIVYPGKSGAYFEMDGKRYLGSLIIYKIDEEHIAYILHVDLETYLLGVVPAEIPTGNRDYLAAIEAQAIAARSYAYYKYTSNKNKLFTMYDDQRDQVLGDMLRANKNAREAIKVTRGQILMSDDEEEFVPYYHSTCGGYFYELPKEQNIILDGNSPEFPAYCSISPLYRWHRILDIRDLLKSLTKNGKYQYNGKFGEKGHKIQMVIQERDSAGRVQKLSVSIDEKQVNLSGYEIRKVFVDSLEKPLPSTWFFVSPFSQDSLKFIIVGSGYGHGKGMCQWGAIGMSLQGRSYEQILNHYYPHAVIRRLY